MSDKTNQLHEMTRYDSIDHAIMIDMLIETGWRWDRDSSNRLGDFRGWWIHPEHETKCRRTGDSKPMNLAAYDAIRLYTDFTPDEVLDRGRAARKVEQIRRYQAAGYSIPA